MYKLIFITNEECLNGYVFQESLEDEKEIVNFIKKFKKDIAEILDSFESLNPKYIVPSIQQDLDLLIKDISAFIHVDVPRGDTLLIQNLNYGTCEFTIIISKIDDNNYDDFINGLMKKNKKEKMVEENFDFVITDRKKKKDKKELEDIGQVVV